MYKSISSVNRDFITSSFLIWLSFIYFSCIIALARIPILLNRSSAEMVKAVILVLFLVLGGE